MEKKAPKDCCGAMIAPKIDTISTMDAMIAIDHFKKLLPCDQFIITGSFGWKLLGLVQNVKDLDIILVNPTESAMNSLDALREPNNSDYPANPNQYKVKFGTLIIDFYVKKTKIDTIDLANGLSIASIKGTIRAKKQYGRMKDFYQLSAIASIFCTRKELVSAIEKEQSKYV